MNANWAAIAAVGVLAIGIFVTGHSVMRRLGEAERAERATIQALRWFAAGAVFATISDVLSDGSTQVTLLVGAIAIVVLMYLEYLISATEDSMG